MRMVAWHMQYMLHVKVRRKILRNWHKSIPKSRQKYHVGNDNTKLVIAIDIIGAGRWTAIFSWRLSSSLNCTKNITIIDIAPKTHIKRTKKREDDRGDEQWNYLGAQPVCGRQNLTLSSALVHQRLSSSVCVEGYYLRSVISQTQRKLKLR